MKGFNLLLALVGGAAIGAACGLLLAPEKGEKTRKNLINKGSELAEKVNELLKSKGFHLSKKEVEEIADELIPTDN